MPEKAVSSVVEYFHNSGKMKSRDWAPSFLAIPAFSKTKLKLTSKAVPWSQEKAEEKRISLKFLRAWERLCPQFSGQNRSSPTELAQRKGPTHSWEHANLHAVGIGRHRWALCKLLIQTSHLLLREILCFPNYTWENRGSSSHGCYVTKGGFDYSNSLCTECCWKRT